MENGKAEINYHTSAIEQTSNIKHQPLHWCICINANQYIENSVPPVDMFRQNNCNIVIGTDSLASNHTLNIIDELKTIHHYFPQIPLDEMLQWATLNGAKALQMNNKFGSLTKGKSPGVVLIDHIRNDHLTSASTSSRIL